MGDDECKPLRSRRIDTPARDIFKLLADPDRHPEFDGSGMRQAGASNRFIAGVGGVFVTKMYLTAMGYEMHNRIVVCEPVIGWEPCPASTRKRRAGMGRAGVRPRPRWT